MSFIICKDVSFSYENKEVLKDVNFTLEEADYLCIVGDNGAGKSTLINGLLGLKKPSRGSILIDEKYKSLKVGYLAQTTNIQKDFPASVYEVVLSGTLDKYKSFGFFYSKKQKELAYKNMKRLNILELKNKSFSQLSGGQAQRVLLARALCASDKFIILDEPAKGLDPIITLEFYEIIKELNSEGIGIIMVSHDVNYGLKYANKVLHLKNEQLFFGDKKQYLESSLGQAFLGGKNVSNY